MSEENKSKNNIIELYWAKFLKAENLPTGTRYYEAFHFCNDEKLANDLLELVLAGDKKATASALPCYEATGETPPQVGGFSIVTNWKGEPKCIIQTTATAILPFGEITFDICKREGEDENLKSWQDNHIAFFTQDGAESGYEFSWDMPVLFEDFKVVYA